MLVTGGRIGYGVVVHASTPQPSVAKGQSADGVTNPRKTPPLEKLCEALNVHRMAAPTGTSVVPIPTPLSFFRTGGSRSRTRR